MQVSARRAHNFPHPIQTIPFSTCGSHLALSLSHLFRLDRAGRVRRHAHQDQQARTRKSPECRQPGQRLCRGRRGGEGAQECRPEHRHAGERAGHIVRRRPARPHRRDGRALAFQLLR